MYAKKIQNIDQSTDQMSSTSFRRWYTLWWHSHARLGFCTVCTVWLLNRFNRRSNFSGTSCDSIVTNLWNPMPLVYTILLYWGCTRLIIGLHWILTIESQDVLCEKAHRYFFSVVVQSVPQPTCEVWTKNPLTDRLNVTKQSILRHLKVERVTTCKHTDEGHMVCTTC